MTSHSSSPYSSAVEKVIRHIYRALAAAEPQALKLDELSAVAGMSKYHFHRIFAAQAGINLNQFIQRLKLKKAAYQLAFMPELKIIDIALDAGFENHESFSRAFKRTYQQTPKQFRQQPDWLMWSEQHQFKPGPINNIEEPTTMNVTICEFPTTAIAALEHHGNPNQLNDTVARFINWRKSSGASPIATSQTFGLAYNDPSTVSAADFRFDVCGSITEPIADNDSGVINKTIPGGRCAKITHRGSHDLMDEKIRYLYNQWLPSQEETLRDFPCFFHYRNLFPQVAEHELITDIYLPLA